MPVTFDGPNKLIILPTAVYTIDVKEDLYEPWKEWVLLNDNSKYLQAFSAVGGDPIGGANIIFPYFFLINGWKIRPHEANHVLTVTGAVLTDVDGVSPFIPTIGAYNVEIIRSVPVRAEMIVSGSGVTAQDKLDIADEVWNKDSTTAFPSDTMGQYLTKKVLSLSKWLGLD